MTYGDQIDLVRELRQKAEAHIDAQTADLLLRAAEALEFWK